MAGSVKNPLLQHRSPAFIRLNGAGVTHPSRCLAAGDGGPKIRRSLRLGNDLIPVDGVDGRVAVTVKHDGRNSAVWIVVRNGCHAPDDRPCRIAAKAEGMSVAAPHAKPECTPMAA